MPRQARKLAGIGASDLPNLAAVQAYVGPAREVVSDGSTLRLQDGTTPGGIVLFSAATVPSQSEAEAGANNTKGMTALRTKQALRARGIRSVIDEGAVLAGANETTAFNAARVAAGAYGTVTVPPGIFNAPGIITDPASPRLWKLSGNRHPDASPVYKIGTDVVETVLPGRGSKYFSRGETAAGQSPVVVVRQDVTHPEAGLISTLGVETYVRPGATGFSWGITSELYDESTSGESNNVAFVGSYQRAPGCTSPGWGGNIFTVQHQDVPSSQSGPTITLELNNWGQNFDDANRRIVLDVTVGIEHPGVGVFNEAYAGVRLHSAYVDGATQNAWFKKGVSVESKIKDVAFDASLANYVGTSPIAFRTGSGNHIDLSSNGTRILLWQSALKYSISGVVAFQVADDYSALFIGSLTTYGSIETATTVIAPAVRVTDLKVATDNTSAAAAGTPSKGLYQTADGVVMARTT